MDGGKEEQAQQIGSVAFTLAEYKLVKKVLQDVEAGHAEPIWLPRRDEAMLARVLKRFADTPEMRKPFHRVEQLVWIKPSEALPEDQQRVLFMGPRGLAMGHFVAASGYARPVFLDEVSSPSLPEHITWWAAVPVGPR